jgi:uncharacterized protein (TIGR04255 family)
MLEKKTPSHINPCPIAEAVVELQFEPSIDADAVYGVLYSHFSKEFSQTERLAILDIPSPIRRSDPNLKYQPQYQLKNHNFILQVGSHMTSLVTYNSYCGWDKFQPKLLSVFDNNVIKNIFKEINRFGLRYINWFEIDIFNEMTLSLDFKGEKYSAKGTSLTTVFSEDIYKATVRITNDARIASSPIAGSIIDIDVQMQPVPDDFLVNLVSYIEKAHDFEKRVFFSLLKESFINSLNPRYELCSN